MLSKGNQTIKLKTLDSQKEKCFCCDSESFGANAPTGVYYVSVEGKLKAVKTAKQNKKAYLVPNGLRCITVT